MRLETSPTQAQLTIADDGVGFDPASVGAGHFGLKSMRERAGESNGMFRIASRRHGGTTVTSNGSSHRP